MLADETEVIMDADTDVIIEADTEVIIDDETEVIIAVSAPCSIAARSAFVSRISCRKAMFLYILYPQVVQLRCVHVMHFYVIR